MKTFLRIAPLCLALMATATAATAQTTSVGVGPITLVVPFGAGTGADQHARVLSKEIGEMLKVTVIVDNRPGANGALGVQAVKAAPADGKTWFIGTNSTQVLSQVLMKRQAYDPLADLTPVRGLTRGYQVMVVAGASPFKDVHGFVAAAKAKPEKLSFGSGSAASQMAGELLKFRADINLLNVPYKSSSAAITELVGGQIDTMFVDLPLAMPLVRSGQIRPLAVSSPTRLPALPNVPTFEEAGVADYRNAFWSGLYVKAGTPPALIKQIADWVTKANSSAASAKYLEAASMERLDASGPDLQKLQSDDLVLARTVAAKAGILPE